jgi:hypothetical protein
MSDDTLTDRELQSLRNLGNEAERAADEIERLRAAMQWRPIETAPKRGVFLAVVDGAVRFVSWGKTSHVPMWGFCLADQGFEDYDLCNPTHWMPLPEPPKEAT